MKLFGGICLLSLAASVGSATIMTFSRPDGTTFGTGLSLPQACGDRVTASADEVCSYDVGVEGYTPNVLVANYSNVLSESGSLATWTTGYGSLVDVVYSGALAGFKLEADSGFLVSLYDFKIAGWPFSDRTVSFEIFDGEAKSLYKSGDVTAPGKDFLKLSPNVTAQTLFLVAGGDFFNSGLDDLRFGQTRVDPTGVPEPSSMALMACGLALAVVRFRRAT